MNTYGRTLFEEFSLPDGLNELSFPWGVCPKRKGSRYTFFDRISLSPAGKNPFYSSTKQTPKKYFTSQPSVGHGPEMAGTRSIDTLCFDTNRYHTELFFASVSQEFPAIQTLDFGR